MAEPGRQFGRTSNLLPDPLGKKPSGKLFPFLERTPDNGVVSNDLIPTKQAAKALGISVSELCQRVKSGEIEAAYRAPGVRGAMYFDREAIASLVRSEFSERCAALNEGEAA